jgi:hypothetical protein
MLTASEFWTKACAEITNGQFTLVEYHFSSHSTILDLSLNCSEMNPMLQQNYSVLHHSCTCGGSHCKHARFSSENSNYGTAATVPPLMAVETPTELVNGTSRDSLQKNIWIFTIRLVWSQGIGEQISCYSILRLKISSFWWRCSYGTHLSLYSPYKRGIDRSVSEIIVWPTWLSASAERGTEAGHRGDQTPAGDQRSSLDEVHCPNTLNSENHW